eukprot:scaffold70274_cov66-Phaeocystis_antarctica.AAC.5
MKRWQLCHRHPRLHCARANRQLGYRQLPAAISRSFSFCMDKRCCSAVLPRTRARARASSSKMSLRMRRNSRRRA